MAVFLRLYLLLASLPTISIAAAGNLVTCDLEAIPWEFIEVSKEQIDDSIDRVRLLPNLRRGRQLISKNDEERREGRSILVERQANVFDHTVPPIEFNQTMIDAIIVKGRRCQCAGHIMEKAEFFCPIDYPNCKVWTSLYGDKHQVNCYKRGWEVTSAVNIWYFLLLWYSLLFAALFCTIPGHHSIKYIVTKTFPGLNTWITEEILRINVETSNQRRITFERTLQTSRRMNGWLSGYKFKIERFEGGRINHTDSGVKFHDDTDTESHLCAICLLDLEKGDRVALIKCGHLFHVECLSEWILKKNLCPLCKAPDVAEEVRSFEECNESDPCCDERQDENLSILKYCQKYLRQKLVDVIIGRGQSQNRPEIHSVTQ